NTGSLEGWIKRIVINTALQRYLSEKVLNIVNENISEDIEIDIDDEDIFLKYLLQINQELPDRYRLVFNLYVLDGYSHNDISEILEISVGTSKSNLSRAKQLLKENIEAYKMRTQSQSL